MVNFSIEKRSPTVPEYLKLRDAVGWEKTPEDITKYGLENAIFSVCIVADGETIGFGRVIGDGGLYFYIQDVIVLPHYQRQGIGTRIMEEIKIFLDNTLAEGAFVGLKSAEGLIQFYERFGFSSRAEDIPGVFMVRR